MTLRLALVIDGNATGAKEALEDTARGVEDLGKKAKNTGDALDKVVNSGGNGTHKKFEWAPLADDLDKVAKNAPPAADALGKVGEGLGQTAAEAPGAAAGIVNVANAAGEAGGKLGGLKAAAGNMLAGLAGGLAATVIAGGISLAAGAFVSYAQEILSDTPRINRDLASHRDLIKQIKGAYAEAEGAASSYGNKSREVLTFQAQLDIGRLQRDFAGSLDDLGPGVGTAGNIVRKGLPSPFNDAIRQFTEDMKDGLGDVIELRRRISAEATGLADDSPFKALAEQILSGTERAAELQEELQRAIDLYKGLTGDADAAAAALGDSAGNFKLAGDNAGAALPSLERFDALLKSIGGAAPLAAPGLPSGPSGLPAGSFASGGWTGHAPTDQVTGFVHGQEYVFDAASTARIGLGNLDAIRRGVAGYAGGGFVGGYAGSYAGSGGSGQASGGWTFMGELARDVSSLRGALSGFGRELARSHDVLAALASTVKSVSERFLDFAFRALDNAVFGNSSGGGFGLIGNVLGLNSGLNEFPPAPTIGGGTYHGGGKVSAFPTTSRSVPPSVFIGAPRLHGGGWLKPGERPVIAMDGEEIGWPDQLARKYGSGSGGTVVNNFNIETPNPRAFAEVAQPLPARPAGWRRAAGGSADEKRCGAAVPRRGP